ncbi:MAG: iron-containing alcohol dehydrogenase [Chloroflexi bacterium]|nr:iron-containing alcohol dehydrogenase [Chloroflexota bacterium]
MMNFEFTTAGLIIFGAGKRTELINLLRGYRAERVFCVNSGSLERAQPIFDLIREAGAHYQAFSVRKEPDLGLILDGVSRVRAFRPDCIVAVGGGSVIDAAKAFAALEANDGDLMDYLEVIGQGQPLENPVRVPVIAMPTTSGTGSEVTRNAVISSPDHRVKVSLRSRTMLPAVALVDPELTVSTPASVTASSGMDALIQLIEPYVSNAASPFTDPLCLQGLKVGAPALKVAYAEPDNVEARTAMAYASLLGGIALTNAKLGAVHGSAGVLGGMFDAPHGGLCARLLPPVIEANLAALRQRQPDGEALARYDDAARAVLGRADATGDDLAAWAWEMNQALAIAPLREYGIETTHLSEIAAKSAKASSMKGNPLVLTQDELVNILEKAL